MRRPDFPYQGLVPNACSTSAGERRSPSDVVCGCTEACESPSNLFVRAYNSFARSISALYSLIGANRLALRLRDASLSMLPSTLAWLAADDEAGRAVEAAGIIAPGQELVDAFRDATRELLALVGVDVDAVGAAEEWDAPRGRGPGHPDSDALERARVDRNRMLLVE